MMPLNQDFFFFTCKQYSPMQLIGLKLLLNEVNDKRLICLK